MKHSITIALEIKGVKDSFGFKRLLGVIHRFLECYDTSVEAVWMESVKVPFGGEPSCSSTVHLTHCCGVDKMIAMQGDEVQLGARIWKEKTHRSPVQTCCHLGRIYTKLYTYIFTFFINLFLLVNNVLQCTSKPPKDGMKKQNSIEKKARHWLCSQHPGSTQWFIWFTISTRSLYLGLD